MITVLRCFFRFTWQEQTGIHISIIPTVGKALQAATLDYLQQIVMYNPVRCHNAMLVR